MKIDRNSVHRFIGVSMVLYAIWCIFHANLVQAMFNFVFGFYILQDVRIDRLNAAVVYLLERENARSVDEAVASAILEDVDANPKI